MRWSSTGATSRGTTSGAAARTPSPRALVEAPAPSARTPPRKLQAGLSLPKRCPGWGGWSFNTCAQTWCPAWGSQPGHQVARVCCGCWSRHAKTRARRRGQPRTPQQPRTSCRDSTPLPCNRTPQPRAASRLRREAARAAAHLRRGATRVQRASDEWPHGCRDAATAAQPAPAALPGDEDEGGASTSGRLATSVATVGGLLLLVAAGATSRVVHATPRVAHATSRDVHATSGAADPPSRVADAPCWAV